ncbi:rhomboid family intramembrane serine protease [Luteibaculum oceani]|uniref:Rhomboid family intramembrane serine protease n=1 Tax=Luteibaculum oceani TaxID=1294296 RepID=A0A5C6UV38_9FLAO|nr:rhomboid family intramembrane serine protease [Luteibaculum oceani]TXC76101.1 rhomboid family intramembrane serine protease [Luteibaculum oceani]
MFLVLIAVIAVVSFLALRKPELIHKLSFSPYYIVENQQWYRFLSHVLVHRSIGHLLINLFVFYTFGKYVLSMFLGLKGAIGELWFYLLLIGAAIFSSVKGFAKHRDNPSYHAVGASGVVSAVLFSFVLFQPLNSIYLFFIPIPIPAFIFGGLYLAYEYFMDKREGGRIAHDAHFYGAIFGILFTIFLDFRILPQFFKSISEYIAS